MLSQPDAVADSLADGRHVSFECPTQFPDGRICRAVTRLPSSAERVVCPQCSRRYSFEACRWCVQTNLHNQFSRVFRCMWCGRETKASRGSRSDAGDYFETLAHRGLDKPGSRKSLVGGLVSIGGKGNPIPYGAICSIAVTTEFVLVWDESGDKGGMKHPLSEVVSFEVGGPGRVKRGRQFIGGGFGVVGAAEGDRKSTRLLQSRGHLVCRLLLEK